MTSTNLPFQQLDWPAPENIHAGFSLRSPGKSKAPYQGFNLAQHVGDSKLAVSQNREALGQVIQKPICWLSQTHSNLVVEAHANNLGLEADASWTRKANIAAAVMTADCLPVFLCDQNGDQVAVIHAGWRGLLSGIIENAIDTFSQPGASLLAYMGPAIGPLAFEVGGEVRDLFMAESLESESGFVTGNNDDKWMADIYQLARVRLMRKGVDQIYGGTECTYSHQDKYFSYRRDGATGRMANIIWKSDI